MSEKLRCAILDDYQRVALSLADWSSLQERVEVRSQDQHLEDLDSLRDCQILVAMRERTRFDAATLQRLPNLKLLVTTGMRNAAIDLPAARALGITVCGTASASEPPVELTWALLLALARGIVPENTALQAGGAWQSTLGADLHGAQLGLLGLGKIGSRVAQIGLAFGMKVAAWSQNLKPETAEALGVEPKQSKEQLLQTSDFVSLHLVLSERTRGLLGRQELALLKPTAYLINTSRAGLVDQTALREALQAGQLAGAGVDVFEQEPLPLNDPMRSLPNLLATPHLGYVTRRNYLRYYQDAVENIQAYLNGTPIRLI
ncbi:hydroxyacid dehydrogenase [bacterium SCN 62-11]|nr:D-2-hydroxyacid dehydrogenase family protein [Candidatus Eremiobacteraeota bacterium]ODT62371.1 MAG: hydroxyacid dehydrogenase [bacterium SCN 62-11]